MPTGLRLLEASQGVLSAGRRQTQGQVAILWGQPRKGPRQTLLLVWAEGNNMRESGELNSFPGPHSKASGRS